MLSFICLTLLVSSRGTMADYISDLINNFSVKCIQFIVIG